MLFLNSYPLPPPTWEGVIIAKVWSAAYRRGKMWRGVKLCYMSTFQSALNATSLMSFRSFSSTPPVPLSLSEREGVPPPHPAVHVRERHDHSPQGEWYLARRTLASATDNLQRRRTSLKRSPPLADGLSRHLYGDVITPVPPTPCPPPRRGGGSARLPASDI